MKNKLLIGVFLALFLILPIAAKTTTTTNNIHAMVDSESVAYDDNLLVNSIVGIAIPRYIYTNISWPISCTGTIVSPKFIITAGHCVADQFPSSGQFLEILKSNPLFIVPWSRGGISDHVYNTPIDTTEKYRVRAVYLPHDYNYADIVPMPLLPYFNYFNQDFALLELEKQLPSKYIPIEIGQNEPTPLYKIFIAGYGESQTEIIYRKLRYRQINYIGSMYGNPSQNYGQIYTQPLIAQTGDDGAPILHFDAGSQRYILDATYSVNIFDFPAAANVSMAKNYRLIKSIIDGKSVPMATKCLAMISGACNNSYIYIPNMLSNTISLFKKNKDNGELSKLSSALTTGLSSPVMTLLNPGRLPDLFGKNHFLLVLNQKFGEANGSLSSYRINDESGSIIYTTRTTYTAAEPETMVFDQSGDYIFVISKNSNVLEVFRFNSENGDITKIQQLVIVEPSAITVSHLNGIVYVTSSSEKKIFPYQFNYHIKKLEPIMTDSRTFGTKTVSEPKQIKLDSTGTLAFVIGYNNNEVWSYRINTKDDGRPSGILSFLYITPSHTLKPTSLIARDGYLYVGSMDSTIISVFLINQRNGELNFIKYYQTTGGVLDMSIDASGENFYASILFKNEVMHFKRDLYTGELYFLSSTAKTGYTPATITIRE